MIDEEVARIAEAARNDMERALANEATLAANLERLKTELEDTNDASVRLRELDRDVQAEPLGVRGLPGAHARGQRAGAARHHQHPRDRGARPAGEPQLPAAHDDPARGRRHAGRHAGRRAGVLRRMARARAGAAAGQRKPADASAAAAPPVTPAPYVPAPPVASASPVVDSPPRQPSPPVAPMLERARQPYEPAAPQAAATTPAPRRKQAFRL